MLGPTGKQLPEPVSQPECARAGQSKVTPMRLWCAHFRLTLVGPCSNTHRVIFILWVELKQLRDALYVFSEVFDLKPTSQTTGRIRFFTH